MKLNPYAAKLAAQAKLRKQLKDMEEADQKVNAAVDLLRDIPISSPEADGLRDQMLADDGKRREDVKRLMDETSRRLTGENAPEDSMAFVRKLVEELQGLQRLREAEGGALTPFLARMHVRVLCSLIDGYIFHLKGRSVAFAKQRQIDLKEGEQTLTKELTDPTFRMRTFENIKRTLLMFKRITGLSGNEAAIPKDLMVMFSVRDRLTHPKRVSDFEMPQDEVVAVAHALEWFRDLIKQAIASEQAHIDEIRANVHGSIDEAIQRIKSQMPPEP